MVLLANDVERGSLFYFSNLSQYQNRTNIKVHNEFMA